MIRLRNTQKGLTLVEILVALALAAVLASALFRIFMGNQQSLALTEAYAKAQDSARTAFELLQSDLRMAQYLGCINSKDAINPDDAASEYITERSILYDDGQLTLRKAIPLDSHLELPFVQGQDFKVRGPQQQLANIKNGDKALLTDCQQAELFTIERIELEGNGDVALIKSANELVDRQYVSGSQLLLIHTLEYSIADSELVENENIKSLWVKDSLDGGDSQEYVPYISEINFSFLVEDSTTGDKEYKHQILSDELEDAKVHAIRVNLKLDTENSCRFVDGDNCLSTQEYERVFFVRNRSMSGGG